MCIRDRLTDGTILRLSVETMSVVAVFLTMAFPLVLILAMMMAVSVFLAFRTAKNITSPINEIDLEHPEQAVSYTHLDVYKRQGYEYAHLQYGFLHQSRSPKCD